MEYEEAKQILTTAQSSIETEKTSSALSALARHVSTTPMGFEQFSGLCKALLDKVAPRIVAYPTEIGNEMLRSFETIFLEGPPSASFSELVASLPLLHESSELAARILVLFVNEQTGGLHRIVQVISKLDSLEAVTSLIHLPSRVTNVLVKSSLNNVKAANILIEDEYFATLARALYAQPTTSDASRDAILGNLIGRLVIMKQAGTLVECMMPSDIDKMQKFVPLTLRAPHRAVEPLVRALLEAKGDERAIVYTLRTLVSRSRAARDACINSIPYKRPLLQCPKIAIHRLVRSICRGCGPSAMQRSLMIASETWSNEEFTIGTDILLQRQVTRLLLHYLRYTAGSASDADFHDQDVMMVLVEGVHLRLSENDVRLRRHGMIVGEAASRYCDEENRLVFERDQTSKARKEEKRIIGDDAVEDGGDSDLSDLAEQVGDAQPLGKNEEDDNFFENFTGVPPTKVGGTPNRGKVLSASERTSPNGKSKGDSGIPTEKEGYSSREETLWPIRDADDDWQIEDDWTSVESYELTASSDEEGEPENGNRSLRRDYAELRKKLSAPMSVPRLLGLLREINSSQDGATVISASTTISALRTLASRAQTNFLSPSTLRSAGVELCIEVGQIDVERYPDCKMEEMSSAREEALLRVLEMDIGECGRALVDRVICGETSDLGRRAEAMSFLSRAVRNAYERVAKECDEEHSEEKQKAIVEVGTVIRRLSKSVAAGKGKQRRKDIVWDVNGIGSVFELLASRLCAGGGASFIRIEGRDNQLWGQGLVTLATLACHGGSGAEGRAMRADVLEISVRRVGRLAGDGVVRRSVALAIGAVIGGMGAAEVEEKLVGGLGEVDIVLGPRDHSTEVLRECFRWLEDAAKGDGDVGVRRFASIALKRWADRVQLSSSNLCAS